MRGPRDRADLAHAHRVGHDRPAGDARVPQPDAGRSAVGLEHDQPFPQRVVADVLPVGRGKLLIDAQVGLLDAPVPDLEQREGPGGSPLCLLATV